MRNFIVIIYLLAGASFLYGLEMDPVDSLPNPYGFERRLLLIDHLKEVYGLMRPGKTAEELADEYKRILVGNHEFGPRGYDMEISKAYVFALQTEKSKDGKGKMTGRQEFTQGDAVRLQLEMEFGIILGPETDPTQAKILLAELLLKEKNKRVNSESKEITSPLHSAVASQKAIGATMDEMAKQTDIPPLAAKVPTVNDVARVTGNEKKMDSAIRTTTEDIHVPLIHQLYFRDVWWQAYNADGKELALVRGGKLDGFEEAAGRIEDNQIVYNKKFESIIRYSIINDLTFEVETPSRILTVSRRINSKRKHWVVMKTTNGYEGDAHIQKFMIFGSESDR